ncbi:divergent PAP2 family protein [Caproiciproducens faecalis]|uniref:divergent PAP2 family protein n=1 Tax=Caproiciproducens faecalis TaxID=2820301 RepID=UPI00210520BF|nr:divergent PAP2 family protein [Caproiciproducens faecalis]
MTYNYLIMIGIISWMSAQLIKTIIFLCRNKRIDFKTLSGSGGMPSAHSALVCSVAVGTAHEYGFGSPYFSLAFTLAVIVMYDAMGVRRAAGQQAKAINDLVEYLKDNKCNLPDEGKYLKDSVCRLNESLGHTPLEVFAGVVLGVCVAVVSIIWFR